MSLKKIGTGLLVAGSLLLMTACSSGTGIADLDRKATEADRWPGEAGQLEEMDQGSVRLLTSSEGADYFVVSSEDQQTVCLYKFGADDSTGTGVGGCGGSGGASVIVEVSAPSTKMMLVRSDAELKTFEEDGWKKIHENILVFETP